MKNNYSNIQEIISTSLSYAEVLRKMKIKPSGGNYATLKSAIKKCEYDISHFTGKAWNQGEKYKPVNPPKKLNEVLVKNNPVNTHKLKLRLIKEGLKKHICENCQLNEWQGKPIPIELDHVDGDRDNNQIENLKILCPNCHAQTDTYRGKNKKRY